MSEGGFRLSPPSSHAAGSYHLGALTRSLLGEQPVDAELVTGHGHEVLVEAAQEAAEPENLTPGELPARYRAVLLGISVAVVIDEMGRRVDVMPACVSRGIVRERRPRAGRAAETLAQELAVAPGISKDLD